MSHSVSLKREARSRLYDIVASNTDSQRKAMLNAYKVKAEINHGQNEIAAKEDHCLIRTLDPIIVLPEGKFAHCPGALITPNQSSNRTTEKVISELA